MEGQPGQKSKTNFLIGTDSIQELARDGTLPTGWREDPPRIHSNGGIVLEIAGVFQIPADLKRPHPVADSSCKVSFTHFADASVPGATRHEASLS